MSSDEQLENKDYHQDDHYDNQSFDFRLAMSKRMMNRYPSRVPVLLKANKKNILFKKNKFLPSKDSTLGNFMYFIKNYVDVNKYQSILAFANNTLIPVSYTMGQIYDTHADADGFLYIHISIENTFG